MSSNLNIVLVHGAWADGSSWNRVIPLLQDNGCRVVAVQIPLTSLAEDVAITRHVLALQTGPSVLVGHSYGGAVITEAGTDVPDVVGLVYISAFSPDEGESIGDLNARASASGQAQIRTDDQGLLWISQEGFAGAFAQDLDPDEARILAAVQKPIAAGVFWDKITKPAWKSKASWSLISENDRMIPPDTQRFMASRMSATVLSVRASHASLVSRPNEVVKLITDAVAKTASV